MQENMKNLNNNLLFKFKIMGNNSGDWNSGYGNSGDGNSGNKNLGNWNLGNKNSGDKNLGNKNSGDGNSGYGNSGDKNLGNWNSGNRNLGNWNSGDGNLGMFCSVEPPLIIFNKTSNKKWSEIDHPHFIEFNLTKWISWTDMTAIEKKNNPKAEYTEGYLQSFDYKTAWANFWKDTDKNNRNKFLALPNFDPILFLEITGIDVRLGDKNIEKKKQILAKIEELKKEAETL